MKVDLIRPARGVAAVMLFCALAVVVSLTALSEGLTENPSASGNNAFAGTNTATTQVANDNSTKLATDAYADRASAFGSSYVSLGTSGTAAHNYIWMISIQANANHSGYCTITVNGSVIAESGFPGGASGLSNGVGECVAAIPAGATYSYVLGGTTPTVNYEYALQIGP